MKYFKTLRKAYTRSFFTSQKIYIGCILGQVQVKGYTSFLGWGAYLLEYFILSLLPPTNKHQHTYKLIYYDSFFFGGGGKQCRPIGLMFLIICLRLVPLTLTSACLCQAQSTLSKTSLQVLLASQCLKGASVSFT